MKLSTAIFLIALLVAFAVMTTAARAGILLGSLSPVLTAQTNTPTFVTNTATINLPQITISNNQLATNTAYSGYFRWSFDNVNFYTNGSPVFIPATTNAASAPVYAQTLTVPIYIQMLAITNVANTTTIQLGVTSP